MEQAYAVDEEFVIRPRTLIAAGGIVTRHGAGGVELAVVVRRRHRDASLPKGKTKPGEPLRETAKREVAEETGLIVEPAGYAGSIVYDANGRAKMVAFWFMEAVGEQAIEDTDEVADVVWMTPEAALDTLSYAEQRSLVAHLFPSALVPAPRRWWSRFHPRSLVPTYRRDDRLEAEVRVERAELEAQVGEHLEGSSEVPFWVPAARRLLVQAEAAHADDDTDEGWRALHACRRMRVHGYTDPEVAARAHEVRLECERKLGSWRKEAAIFLLTPKQVEGEARSLGTVPVTRRRLQRAMAIRDEHFGNMWLGYDMVRTQLRGLVVAMTVSIVLFVWLLGGAVAPTGNVVVSAWRPPFMAMAAGLLGGSFSAFLTFARTGKGARIPTQLTEHLMTWVRVWVGAAAGLAMYLFLNSGLQDLVFSFDVANRTAQLFLAFAAGFSERLVRRSVEAVSGGSGKAG